MKEKAEDGSAKSKVMARVARAAGHLSQMLAAKLDWGKTGLSLTCIDWYIQK